MSLVVAKWWLACVALLGELTGTRACWAAEVRWVSPPGCTDPRGTVEEAERLLGRSLDSVRSLDFDVRITDDEGRWRLKLGTVERATGERRERELSGGSCDEVTAAAAVALAMVVNASEPHADEVTAEATPAAAPSAEHAATNRPALPPSSASPLRSPRKSRSAVARTALSASVAIGGDSGALPAAALGGEAAVSVDHRQFRLTGLGALIAGSQRQDGKGADFQLLFGALLACGRRPMGPTVAAICVGVEMGELRGTGAGVRNPRSGTSLWWAPRLDAGVTLPFSTSWALWGRLGATLPQERREFVLGDGLFTHRPDQLTGRLSLGVELQLM
jgi:hypothetical protein